MQAVAQVRQPVRTEAVWDFLQMCTGVALVLFMWAHMILVASVNIDLGGGRVMNLIAHFFEATYMAQLGGPLIFLTMVDPVESVLESVRAASKTASPNEI